MLTTLSLRLATIAHVCVCVCSWSKMRDGVVHFNVCAHNQLLCVLLSLFYWRTYTYTCINGSTYHKHMQTHPFVCESARISFLSNIGLPHAVIVFHPMLVPYWNTVVQCRVYLIWPFTQRPNLTFVAIAVYMYEYILVVLIWFFPHWFHCAHGHVSCKANIAHNIIVIIIIIWIVLYIGNGSAVNDSTDRWLPCAPLI